MKNIFSIQDKKSDINLAKNYIVSIDNFIKKKALQRLNRIEKELNLSNYEISTVIQKNNYDEIPEKEINQKLFLSILTNLTQIYYKNIQNIITYIIDEVIKKNKLLIHNEDLQYENLYLNSLVNYINYTIEHLLPKKEFSKPRNLILEEILNEDKRSEKEKVKKSFSKEKINFLKKFFDIFI
jgi:hypothetical protein